MDNIKKTAEEFEGYLKELQNGVSDERERQIYRQAVICDDLMKYSNEVVDTNHKDWLSLIQHVQNVFLHIKEKNKKYSTEFLHQEEQSADKILLTEFREEIQRLRKELQEKTAVLICANNNCRRRDEKLKHAKELLQTIIPLAENGIRA